MLNAIVPVSNSADQLQGIAMAKSLALTVNVSVDLITVIDADANQETHDERLATAWRFLEQQAAQFPDETSVRQLIRSGNPADEILNAVAENPASFLVLSPRWADATRSFMPDSLSERLMAEARVPVLLSTTDQWPRSLSIDNVMIPVTRTTPSASQIQDLSEALGQRQTIFRLVYISNGGESHDGSTGDVSPSRDAIADEGAGYHARWRLMELAADLRRHGIRSTWEMRYGDPAHELARAATTTGANLIVFHGGTLDEYSPDPTDQLVLRVSHNAATPALLVPSHYQLPGTHPERVEQSHPPTSP